MDAQSPFFGPCLCRRGVLSVLLAFLLCLQPVFGQDYVPSAGNLARREKFSADRFGIFLHWGIYSLYAQGEWYLNAGLGEEEYSKAADAFYPHRFNADEWVSAVKASGAGYITLTSRHHDGFSMFKTAESGYNVVDGTPFGRDVVGELSEACKRHGIDLYLYYSILDWRRPDYPLGRTGLRTGRTPKPDYDGYFNFMKRQIRELLTQYDGIRGLWFDGYWDHDADSVPFDWSMEELYAYIHSLRPDCLIGNNHHIKPLQGEDFQMFERDLPGENTAGLSGQEISRLPLEMCQTMNGMWGYKVADTDYKPADELIRLLVRAAGKGSNLLLNIGPQPNGELPAVAVNRLKSIGEWMKRYGHTIRRTTRTAIGEQSWGTTTQRGDTLFLHVLSATETTLRVPLERKAKSVRCLTDTAVPLAWKQDTPGRLDIELNGLPHAIDFIIEIVLEK